MNFTEGFGKRWIDRILGKVDKDQGVANAGKVLGIGNDGQVVPVEQSGGGSSITVDSALNAESTNPVENKAIASALSDKLDSKATTAGRLMISQYGSAKIITGYITYTTVSLSLSLLNGTRTIDNVQYKVYSCQTGIAGNGIGPFTFEQLYLNINDTRYDVVEWYYAPTPTFENHLPSTIKCELILSASSRRIVGNIYIPADMEITSISGIAKVSCINT